MGFEPLTTVTSYRNRHRLTNRGRDADSQARLDSGDTDSGATPTWRIRPGNVMVKVTSSGRYVEANDTAGDAPTAPAVLAAEAGDDDWKGAVVTLWRNGVSVVAVTLGGSDNTTALVNTALNANAIFAANAIASASGSPTKTLITGLVGGADQTLKVTCDLASAFGANGTDDVGSDPDYVVTETEVDLQDRNGTAIHQDVPVSRLGDYDESELINLTSEARRVLLSRGSTFA